MLVCSIKLLKSGCIRDDCTNMLWIFLFSWHKALFLFSTERRAAVCGTHKFMTPWLGTRFQAREERLESGMGSVTFWTALSVRGRSLILGFLGPFIQMIRFMKFLLGLGPLNDSFNEIWLGWENLTKKPTPLPGIEPGSPAWQAGILTTILQRLVLLKT